MHDDSISNLTTHSATYSENKDSESYESESEESKVTISPEFSLDSIPSIGRGRSRITNEKLQKTIGKINDKDNILSNKFVNVVDKNSIQPKSNKKVNSTKTYSSDTNKSSFETINMSSTINVQNKQSTSETKNMDTGEKDNSEDATKKRRRSEETENTDVNKPNIPTYELDFVVTKRGKNRVIDSGNNNITHPTGATPDRPKAQATTSTQNRFDVLTNEDDPNLVDHFEYDSEEDEEKTTKKTRPPPPTVLHGRPQNYSDFIKLLKHNAPTGFTVKQTTKNTTIYFKNNAE